jgi:uncharacterized alpha-E superfamily protein
MTTRIIDVAAATLLGREDLARFDNSLWMAVLQSLSAYQMYRQKVRRRVHAPDVMLYLFKDQQFPRSVAFSLRELASALSSLPRNAGPLIRLGELRRMLAVFEVTRIDVAALHKWNDDAQLALGELHSLVHATWFEPTTSAAGAAAAAAAQVQTQTQTQTSPLAQKT